jgi:hypothetical protein
MLHDAPAIRGYTGSLGICSKVRDHGRRRRRILVIEDNPEPSEQLIASLATSSYLIELVVEGQAGEANS